MDLTIPEDDYLNFLFEITGKIKVSNKNKRDKAFNIMITKENAQKVVSLLYYPKCLSLSRKKENAEKVLDWIRPSEMKFAPPRKFWNTEEDTYILKHTIEESMQYTGRTPKSIKVRL